MKKTVLATALAASTMLISNTHAALFDLSSQLSLIDLVSPIGLLLMLMGGISILKQRGKSL